MRAVEEAKESVQSKLNVAESALVDKSEELDSLRRALAEQSVLSDVVSNQKTEILGLTDSLLSAKVGRETAQKQLDTVAAQLKEAEDQIENLKAASAEASQRQQKAEHDLRTAQDAKVDLEQKLARLKADADQALAEHQSAEAKILIEKNELLSKQVGQLEAASQHAESSKQELKDIISAQQQRIGELESAVNTAPDAAVGQSEAAAESNAALLKIEAALEHQTQRMKAIEDANLQSLAKIAQLQSSTTRGSSHRRSKSSAQSGSSSKSSNSPEKLSNISGIGPTYQKKLKALGVETIKEISEWSDADIENFAGKLGCGETMTRDWKEKAKVWIGQHLSDPSPRSGGGTPEISSADES